MNTALMLEDLGHTAIEAQSGEQALEILKTGLVPDVIVTDHAMPDMTGAELIDHLIDSYPGIPLILATGYAELPSGLPADIQRLAKPFTQSQLQNAVLAAVNARAVQAAPKLAS